MNSSETILQSQLKLLLKNIKKVETIAHGNSMYPYLKNGTKIILNPIFGNLKLGDVIVFEINNRVLMHRIVKLEAESIFTKGDFNFRPDASIKKEQVLGKLEAIYVDSKWVDFYNYKKPLKFWLYFNLYAWPLVLILRIILKLRNKQYF